ncbi:ATP-binding cassette domain-containing protein [Colwellia sp. D2M02]|uniref:metal ABC transporter ATP-binding protein n=1 Tax=Colwellia sp. D2M02 TaxID=2841562 RepID=UPI001C099EA0|nr:ATP-binding cassette domain-containing protein [Colwellia sp. D2M02]
MKANLAAVGITGPAIEINNLGIQLGKITLLSAVSTTMSAGLWHGIVGPNGGGKSTLLKSIAGLMPHSGSIAMLWSNTKAPIIGYMPQLAPFEQSLPISVLDYLRLNSQNRPVWLSFKKRSEINDVVELLAIKTLLNNRVGTLSMGERQRVLLACALLQKPSLLLLDEPLAGIDKAGQEKILAVLTDFKKQGGTIVMVEHNWQVLQQYCDQAYFIDGGLKKSGNPTEVLQQQLTEQSLEQAQQRSLLLANNQTDEARTA